MPGVTGDLVTVEGAVVGGALTVPASTTVGVVSRGAMTAGVDGAPAGGVSGASVVKGLACEPAALRFITYSPPLPAAISSVTTPTTSPVLDLAGAGAVARAATVFGIALSAVPFDCATVRPLPVPATGLVPRPDRAFFASAEFMITGAELERAAAFGT